MATILNDNKVGIGASVSLNVDRTLFTILGDTHSFICPGYRWKNIVTTAERGESELAILANNAGAISITATVNSNDKWVLWGYVQD